MVSTMTATRPSTTTQRTARSTTRLDNDKYGDKSNSINACDEAPNGYVDNDDDCNDANSLIYPGANEISWNGTDENCDGTDFNGKGCLEDAGEYAPAHECVWMVGRR